MPGLCEALMDMRINRGSAFKEGQVLIETYEDVSAKYGLALAPALVEGREGDIVNVRVLHRCK